MAAVKPTSVKHRFSKPWDGSDVVFVVNKEEFHCHYAVVKLNSTVLAFMVTSKSKGDGERVVLPDKNNTSDYFFLFLELMYPLLEKFEPDRTSLLIILMYCKEYQAASVKLQVDLIFATMLSSSYDENNEISQALEDLCTAEEYDLEKTRNMCIRYLSRAKLSENKLPSFRYKGLSIETKYHILVEQFHRFTLQCIRNRFGDITSYPTDGTFELLQALVSQNYK